MKTSNPCGEIALDDPQTCNLLWEEMMTQSFSIVVEPPRLPWWTFTYNEKPREALVFGPNVNGNIFCWTPDGFRSFRPAQMIGIEDVTCVATN